MINTGIIGYGYWGPNLVRNFSNLKNCKIAMVADLDADRLSQLKKQYPDIITTTSTQELIDNTQIDSVVIATPVFLHYELAKKALEAGKHVLIEKPMTSSSDEAKELIEIAQKKNKILMVDHTFLYTGAVNKIKKLIETGEMGRINYFDSTRINLGLFQPDINVIYDLAPHDISILFHLIDERPISLNANGVSHTNNDIENIAYVNLNFQSDMIAHFTVSWSSPVKIRQTLIGGDKKMIQYNDLDLSEKIKVYDTGYNIESFEAKRKIMVDYRTGDIHVPKIESTEALLGMAGDFINSIMNNTDPISNWQSGLDVVKVLDASQKSIKNNGMEVKIN